MSKSSFCWQNILQSLHTRESCWFWKFWNCLELLVVTNYCCIYLCLYLRTLFWHILITWNIVWKNLRAIAETKMIKNWLAHNWFSDKVLGKTSCDTIWILHLHNYYNNKPPEPSKTCPKLPKTISNQSKTTGMNV